MVRALIIYENRRSLYLGGMAGPFGGCNAECRYRLLTLGEDKGQERRNKEKYEMMSDLGYPPQDFLIVLLISANFPVLLVA